MTAKIAILTAASVLALAAAAATPALASIRAHKPRPAEIAHPAVREAPYRAPPAVGGVWTPLDNPFPGVSPDTPLQLTDGRVMVHDGCTRNVYALTPDASGSYVHGTWKKLASLPKNYAPLYFASQVLADGRVVMSGGENNGAGCNLVWTNLGAIYDPVANHWTAVSPPKGWTAIGDAQSAILPDGRYLLANAIKPLEVTGTFDKAGAPTWTATGISKKDRNDEEGWTQTPFQTVLTVDATRNQAGPVNKTEIYDIATGIWSDGEDTPNQLVDPDGGEIGPAVLIPSGKIFQVGGRPCSGDAVCAGHTAVYDTLTGHWTAGPDIPYVNKASGDSSDGPAALLPNGNVLIQTGPFYATPSHFFEWNGVRLIRVSEPAQAPDITSFEGRMMVLPTGEIFWTSDLGDIEVYATRYKANPDWAPTIAGVATTLARGHVGYDISGVRFNGMTEGSGYGDDAQSFTNFPLVRITNSQTGHVCYARTHGHSAMGINAPGDPTSTKFDLPKTCDAGAGKLVVVANGMASPPVDVTVN